MSGAWLGVDVGSGADKLLNFCLIQQGDGDAVPRVLFERGQVRSRNPAYPPNRSGQFDRCDRWPPISPEAEWHVRSVINSSELVMRWRAADVSETVAVVDAPSGF